LGSKEAAREFSLFSGISKNGNATLTLFEQTQKTTESLGFQQLIRGYVEHITGSQACAPLRAEVHPDDQMLLHSLNHHQNSDIALSQYFAISLQQFYAAHQVMNCFFGRADLNALSRQGITDPSLKILDFACGFGRLLRLLSTQIPARQIYASEIQPDAVAYVCDQFGVQGLISHPDPNAFNSEEKFDFIWVASLFSHLPEHLFHAWMEKLTALLSPRGVLCFSIRDAALLSPAQQLPDSGILYLSESETTPLAEDIYGTSYVNEAFVAASIERAMGKNHPYFRIRKSLAHEQDLYVVPARREQSFVKLENFRRGAWGWVDLCRYSNGHLELEGWAASLDEGVLREVTVFVDGVPMACVSGLLRSDVAAAFGDERLAFSGWKLSFETSKKAQTIEVLVEAKSTKNERSLLFFGKIVGKNEL
jgi:2-polyprenyl-3-methyl-5-hydroxy-6-metoxy-1,4-benzoquinol methylase